MSSGDLIVTDTRTEAMQLLLAFAFGSLGLKYLLENEPQSGCLDNCGTEKRSAGSSASVTMQSSSGCSRESVAGTGMVGPPSS